MGAIQIYEKATGQVTPLELFQGDVVGAVPVYKEGDLYHQVKEDLADKLMAILSTYQRGQIDLGQIQNAQLYVLEQSRIAQAEMLATVERMSDRALTSNEGTIAQLTTTIQTMANAMATKSAGANVRVEVKTTSNDRYIDYEWMAWGVLFAGIVGMTLVISASIFQSSRPQYQPQTALPQIEARSL